MIDHIGLAVSNYQTSKEFYLKTLSPLGIQLMMEVQGWAGFGKEGKADFWFGEHSKAQSPMHIAFLADNRAEVDAFYEAGMASGAKDNGKPGLREEYHPHYYGAFLIDPDGHNIEAVCHKPE
ncbi:MAG: VOC family protein [Gammaproteobacteria bacterium]|nr:VOC family protein [Gammaproteobacteria bacterium]